MNEGLFTGVNSLETLPLTSTSQCDCIGTLCGILNRFSAKGGQCSRQSKAFYY